MRYAVYLDNQVSCQSRNAGSTAVSETGMATGSGLNVVAACRRLHAAIDALDQRAADTLGISRNDLRCLNLLEHGPLPPTQLCVALGLTSGSITTLVDRLAAKGLVARARDPSDRRGVLVSATPHVYATIGRLYRGCAEAVAKIVATYPIDERGEAVRHLSDVAAAWEDATSSK